MIKNPKVSGLKILIAEDDEISALLLTILVKEFQEQVFRAKTGIEAIDICYKNPDIDLIFMDIQMPGLNGDEAARKIQEFNKDVIIIAQTSFGLSGDREKAITAGCNDYITKPINKDQLDSLIQKHFKK
jgi:CheY-like chemotaxis protein